VGWTTRNEVDYISDLVTGKVGTGRVPIPKLLKNYIKGAKRRTIWGTFDDVDGPTVIAYATALLEKLECRMS